MRTTVISGASSGIGRAVASLLAARGERVVGVDLADASVNADLSVEAGRRQAVATLLETLDTIDAVIACAGVSPPAPGPRIVSVNYFGVIRLLEGLLPRLQAGPSPRALVISSIASLFPPDEGVLERCAQDDEQGACAAAEAHPSLAYRTSKRALTQWVRRCAPTADWAGKGVLLNGIAPGMVLTPMGEAVLGTPESRAAIAKSIPLAVSGYARAEEIAPLLAFLASAENRFMVGQVPFVDGGSDVLLRGAEPL